MCDLIYILTSPILIVAVSGVAPPHLGRAEETDLVRPPSSSLACCQTPEWSQAQDCAEQTNRARQASPDVAAEQSSPKMYSLSCATHATCVTS